MEVAGGYAKEFFKDFMLVFAGYANARIGDVQLNMVITAINVNADLWLARTILQCIIQKIENNTHQVQAIPFQAGITLCPYMNIRVVLFELEAHGGGHFINKVLHVKMFVLEINLFFLEHRKL